MRNLVFILLMIGTTPLLGGESQFSSRGVWLNLPHSGNGEKPASLVTSPYGDRFYLTQFAGLRPSLTATLVPDHPLTGAKSIEFSPHAQSLLRHVWSNDIQGFPTYFRMRMHDGNYRILQMGTETLTLTLDVTLKNVSDVRINLLRTESLLLDDDDNNFPEIHFPQNIITVSLRDSKETLEAFIPNHPPVPEQQRYLLLGKHPMVVLGYDVAQGNAYVCNVIKNEDHFELDTDMSVWSVPIYALQEAGDESAYARAFEENSYAQVSQYLENKIVRLNVGYTLSPSRIDLSFAHLRETLRKLRKIEEASPRCGLTIVNASALTITTNGQ